MTQGQVRRTKPPGGQDLFTHMPWSQTLLLAQALAYMSRSQAPSSACMLRVRTQGPFCLCMTLAWTQGPFSAFYTTATAARALCLQPPGFDLSGPGLLAERILGGGPLD